MSELIGAERGERRPRDRATRRNGHRLRRWDTRARAIELQITMIRQGSYFLSLLEPRRNSEQTLSAVVHKAYVCGFWTGRVDRLVESLRLRVSKSGPGGGLSTSSGARPCTRGSTGSRRTACLDEFERPRQPEPVQPFPDARMDEVASPVYDPAARYALREGMERALLATIQKLPRQPARGAHPARRARLDRAGGGRAARLDRRGGQ